MALNFRLAAKAVIVHDGKVLLVQRTPDNVQKPSIWELPGGRLEPGEDPFLGLKREIQEETKLDIAIHHPLTVRHFTRADGQIVTLINFACTAENNTVVLSNEHQNFAWLSLKEAKQKINPFFHPELEAYETLGIANLFL